ncbi:hypothetical protein TRFO_21061 [Tritrichomonas foetus]|uniref:Uncharacterized protein n=1 Tax=Tritrichomonas foetus TaxID=1144522 RepID=A0A1J4KG92_9EUKA|nr:hypothetical protein TRFO_21061 [Tritrichomonas foetus]|eukprot:OHT09960.1 hypothetical protein TRFO_21061 [Tritrichomonas foetus]
MSSTKKTLRTSIKTVHQIAQTIQNDSTLLSSLQEKVNENLELKEKNASLEMQLKIEKESNKLQSAEFAFKENEFLEEIKSLKIIIENFRKGITNNAENASKRYYEVDVLLQSEKEKVIKLNEKIMKWKSRSKEYLQQIETFKKQIGLLNQEIDSLKASITSNEINAKKQLEIQINLIKEQSHHQLNEKDELIRKMKQEYENEKNGLHQRVRELESQIKICQENNERQLKEQQRNFQNQYKEQEEQIKEEENNYEIQINRLKRDNEKLNITIRQLKNQILEFERKYNDLNNKNQQFEFEHDFLSRSLDVPNLSSFSQTHSQSDDENNSSTNGIFDPINNKVLELIEKSHLVERLVKENEHLKKKLDSAAIEIRERKHSDNYTFTSKEDKEDELIKSLQFALRKTREELDRAENNISNLKMRLRFAKFIDKTQIPILNAVADFHTSVFHTEQSNFKAIILAIMFAKKFPLIAKYGGEINPSSLAFGGGKGLLSYEKKIRDLRSKMTDLEHDILFMKQSADDAQFEINRITSEKEAELHNSRLNPDAEKQIYKLKQHIGQLTRELSQKISPELYNKVTSNLEQIENVNKSLKEEIKRLTELLDKRNKRHSQMKLKFREYILASDHQSKMYQLTQRKIEKQTSEIDSLKCLLREKTREILALERLVNRHTVINDASIKSCANLAVENEQMMKIIDGSFDGFIESPKCKLLHGKSLMCKINPVFLGNDECDCCC